MKPGSWRDVVVEIGAQLREADLVTFVLGAGCSLSSGAPSLAAVEAELMHHFGARLGADGFNALHRIPMPERVPVLAALFRDVVPYVGYRLLAALARNRRVVVLNFNWDNALKLAAEAVGTPYAAVDVEQVADPCIPAGHGLYDVHLHGMFPEAARHGRYETSSFSAQAEELIRSALAVQTTMVIGTALGDVDFEHCLRDLLAERPATQRSRWYFGRGAETSNESLRRFEFVRATEQTFHEAPDIDFDVLLLHLLAGVAGRSWDDHRANLKLDLPAIDELVLPRPELLRPVLDERVIVLPGEAQLGTTTIAAFLAYTAALGALGDAKVHYTSDELSALSALATFGMDDSADVYVVDDPFGSAEFASNPLFLDRLRRVPSEAPRAWCYVTTRLRNWERALPAADPAGIPAVSPDPSRWYDPGDLQRFADDFGISIQPEELRPAARTLNTPARIRHAATVRGLGADPRETGATIDEQAVEDKCQLLDANPSLARLCALVRLQDFSGTLLSALELERVARVSREGLPSATALLYEFHFEGRPHLGLQHPTDRQAVDRWMAGHMAELDEELSGADSIVPSPLAEALAGWRLVAAAGDGGPIPEDARDEVVREVAPRLLAARPGAPGLLDRLDVPGHDLWSLSELALELIRLWPDLPQADRRRFLTRLLSDEENMGAYAVFEACLYLQAAVPDEVWAAMKERLWELTAQPELSREMVLVLDGLLWRPPPRREEHRPWIDAALRGLDPDRPTWGFVRYVSAYHQQWIPGSGLEPYVRSDARVVLNNDHVACASWLVQWHFLHQARARALLVREPLVDLGYLYRAPRNPQNTDLRHDPVVRLLQDLLARPGNVGWALVLLSSLCGLGMPVAGDAECVQLVREALPGVADDDVGLVAAVLTYEAVPGLRNAIHEAFAERRRRDALLDALVEGVELDGLRLVPPRFLAARPAAEVYDTLGITWPELDDIGIAVSDPVAFADELYARAKAYAAAHPALVLPATSVHVLARAAGGDLRGLVPLAAARSEPHGGWTLERGYDALVHALVVPPEQELPL